MSNLFNHEITQTRIGALSFGDHHIQAAQRLCAKWAMANTNSETPIKNQFLQDIFNKILGYKCEIGDSDNNLWFEERDNYNKIPDAILGYGFAHTHPSAQLHDWRIHGVIRAVIECKKSNDKKYDEAIDQAFRYAHNLNDIEFVIYTDFKHIELYKYGRGRNFKHEFILAEMANDTYKCREFMAIMGCDNLFTSQANQSFTHNLPGMETINEQDFYRAYYQVRYDLWQELMRENHEYDKEFYLYSAQKILDRLIFIKFCINKGALKYNVIEMAITAVFYSNYYDAIKQLFEFMDKGINKPTFQIDAFNGGLFAPDPLLNALKIPDSSMEKLFNFCRLNFNADLDVNILGHIFEQSLNDWEDMLNDRPRTRHAQGITYTPPVITQQMVNESLETWLLKHCPDYKTRPDTPAFWLQYAQKLAGVTIIDPACGSGAFLVEVYNQLLTRWHEIHKKLRQFGHEFVHNDTDILLKNIYGVDLNKASVRITQLSLWLKIAHLKRALIVLDKNIKVGNSLIDNEDYSGRYTDYEYRIKQQFMADLALFNDGKDQSFAFKWQREFKDIMDNGGFDIVIGNPPYVFIKSTLQGKEDYQAYYDQNTKSQYPFRDLYSHFIIKAFDICQLGGVVCLITSNSYWTLGSLHHIRQLLCSHQINHLTNAHNPFLDVTVETAIFTATKQYKDNILINNPLQKNTELEKYTAQQYNNPVMLHDLTQPTFAKTIKQGQIIDNYEQKFFIDYDNDTTIPAQFLQQYKNIMGQWWGKINTSKSITQNLPEISQYRQQLQPGDFTILGLLTDGGVGLGTANNGKFIGVYYKSKMAERVRAQRTKKICDYILKHKIPTLGDNAADIQKKLHKMNEYKLWEFIDKLKEKHGRDILGKGFLYRIIHDDDIANIDNITDDEKLNGINGLHCFVHYDKGDRDGNQWYAPPVYYIDWSKQNVEFLRKNSGKKGEGMPVVRNPQFNFKEGFCWNGVLNPNSRLIKCRIKEKTIHDVASMSLTSIYNGTSDKFFVALLNSNFAFNFLRKYINSTVGIQINDIRQLPVIIPTPAQLAGLEAIFDNAMQVKLAYFGQKISPEKHEYECEKIQAMLDSAVEKLYNL